MGGTPVSHAGRNRYQQPGQWGPVEATVRSTMLTPFPTLEAGGRTFRTGPDVPVWLQVVAALPIALVPARGCPGALVAVLAVAANVAVLRSSMPVGGQAGSVVGVGLLAVLVWAVLAAVLLRALG